jgi:chitodextrinase
VFDVTNNIEILMNADADPTQPRNLRIPGRSVSEAWLSWQAPQDMSGFRDYEITVPGRPAAYTTALAFIIPGLTPEIEYLVRIQPRRHAGFPAAVSQSITVVTHDVAPPTKPKALKLTALTSDSASLSWTASTSQGGRLGYRVLLNGSLVAVTDQTHCTLTHLQDLTDFQVKVRAVKAAGIMSLPISLTFSTALHAPRNLRFTQRNGACRLAWDPNFAKFPTHVVSINGNQFVTDRGRVGYNFKLADLSPGPAPHHFDFSVYAKLDNAVSKATQLDWTINDDVPPSKPSDLVVTNITDDTATLTWVPSSDNVGVTGYRVCRHGIFLYNTVAPHFTFEGLTSGSYFFANVRARDKDGNLSAPSETVVFKTTGQAPEPPPSAPNISVTALTSTKAKLEWSVVGSGSMGVRIIIDHEFYEDVLVFLGKNLLLDNLSPDMDCLIEVRAFDLYGQLSEPATLVYTPRDVTPPSVPQNLRKTASTSDTVTLTWQESTDDIGICEYVVYNNHEYFDRAPSNYYTAVDLIPGSYVFDVCALDLSGNASAPASIVVEVS